MIDIRTAGVTVSDTVLDVTPENDAETDVIPWANACARPFEAVVFPMVATDEFEDVHAAADVISCLLPSE